MSKQAKWQQKWRTENKQKMVTCMGDKCQTCGYYACNDVLEFHHINPLEKEMKFGSTTRWDIISEELKKCILLCSNCHREVHAGFRNIPEFYQKFDEKRLEKVKIVVDMLKKID